MIVGQNSIVNQFVPTFRVHNLIDGQILVYDACKKAFVNVSVCDIGGDGVKFLGQLINVANQVDNPLIVEDGQALVYDALYGLWTNKFIDTSVKDLIEFTETITIAARHQYIVTSELQVDGYIINNGVIAIL